jgi:hypothetical protein
MMTNNLEIRSDDELISMRTEQNGETVKGSERAKRKAEDRKEIIGNCRCRSAADVWETIGNWRAAEVAEMSE